MKRKSLLWLLALLVCMTMFTAAVFATETEATETESTETESAEPTLLSSGQHPETGTASFSWELYSDGTLKMLKGTSSQFSSTSKYPAFSNWRLNTKITVNGKETTVDDFVTHIEFGAGIATLMVQHDAKYVVTANWEKLVSINLGNIKRMHNNNANYTGFFENNPNLISITNSSTTSVNNADYVANLERVTRYDNSIDANYMFRGTPLIQKVVFATSSMNSSNNLVSLGKGMFWECTGLREINIPTWITSVNANAFYGCSGLTSITFPLKCDNYICVSTDGLYGTYEHYI